MCEEDSSLAPQGDVSLVLSPSTATYYLMGWDPETGVPTRLTLERLGLDWVAEDLALRGKLPG